MSRIAKLISGGQTGADRAALDVAIFLDIPHGGWCPKGRRAEDGPIADRYRLTETESARYFTRTVMNIREADATVVLSLCPMSQLPPRGGSALTIRLAEDASTLWAHFDLTEAGPFMIHQFRAWLAEGQVGTLNVAGPRESTAPGMYAAVRAFLLRTLPE